MIAIKPLFFDERFGHPDHHVGIIGVLQDFPLSGRGDDFRLHTFLKSLERRSHGIADGSADHRTQKLVVQHFSVHFESIPWHDNGRAHAGDLSYCS